MVEPGVAEQVCLNIYYVYGHKSNKSYVVFKSSMTGKSMHNDTITGPSGCVNLVPHPSYEILITDKDAEKKILSTPAFIITGVSVLKNTQYPTTTALITNTPSGWFKVTVATLVLIIVPRTLLFSPYWSFKTSMTTK